MSSWGLSNLTISIDSSLELCLKTCVSSFWAKLVINTEKKLAKLLWALAQSSKALLNSLPGICLGPGSPRLAEPEVF